MIFCQVGLIAKKNRNKKKGLGLKILEKYVRILKKNVQMY